MTLCVLLDMVGGRELKLLGHRGVFFPFSSHLLAGQLFLLSCKSSSLVLVPWASCSLLVSTDIPNTSLPVSRKKPQSFMVS